MQLRQGLCHEFRDGFAGIIVEVARFHAFLPSSFYHSRALSLNYSSINVLPMELMTTLRARLLSPLNATESLFIEDAVVVVDEAGIISEVATYDGRPVESDLRGGLLVPGFVDTHIHFPQTRVIGRASGPLLPWLENVVFPEEARFADSSHAEAVADIFCGQLARHGTTLPFVYSSVHEQACDVLFRAFKKRGYRAFAGPVLMDRDCPDSLTRVTSDAIRSLERLAADWHSERLRLAVIPRFALSCSPELLREGARFAQEHSLFVSTHMSENVDECRLTVERFGTDDYLQVYENAGLIHERTILAHCIHCSESELSRMKEAGLKIAHCPDSNAFLGSGGMPVDLYVERGIEVTLGTDIAAGRTFSVPEICARAYDNGRAHGVELSLRTLFYWGTRGGALALGVPEVGHLAVGAEADMCLVSMPDWIESEEEALNALLFDRANTAVEKTWVKGALVYDASQ